MNCQLVWGVTLPSPQERWEAPTVPSAREEAEMEKRWMDGVLPRSPFKLPFSAKLNWELWLKEARAQ